MKVDNNFVSKLGNKNSFFIRPEEFEDYSQITLVNNSAFGGKSEAKLIEKIRQSDRYIPELTLVAELDDKIVGHIMFSYVDLVEKEVTKVLALAPMAVLPQYQNCGIGSLLVTTGLKVAAKTAAPLVIVLGHNKFYSRFGFQTAIAYDIQSSFEVPNEIFMVYFLNGNSNKHRGKVVYPAAFNNV